jgi:4-diphosphocytidyl-2-C-methyl-D-erythritol kinase
MLSFPTAKINLGLQILRKRGDGFHDLETVFYPVGWQDALEVVANGEEPLQLTMSGLPVAGDLESNLCYKAWKLIAADYSLPPLQAHLHKMIPMGAGLGGGSSDAAFMLKLLNEVNHVGINEDKLCSYAAQLGSDCAFFVRNKPAFATGRGEVLEDFLLDLSNYYLQIVMPEVTVPTAAAYSWITPMDNRKDIQSILQQPIATWKTELINDFQQPVCERFPIIAELISQLYNEGAIYAAMSGSGAAVFGIFDIEPAYTFSELKSWKGKMIV